ncbi:MAG: diguanylate cyclase [Clostridiales bacterium]|nr:diguanylate cyclase [Clostridiales bacterium]
MLENYMATAIFECLALLILLFQIQQGELLDFRKKRYFRLAILVCIGIIVAEACSLVCDNQTTDLRLCSILSNMMGFVATPFLPLLLMVVLNNKQQKIRIWMLLPAVLSAVLAVLSPWGGFIFAVSPANIYSRGPLFWVFIAASFWGVAIAVVATGKVVRHYRQGARLFFAILAAFLLLGTTVQTLLPGIHTSWICIVLSLLLYYGFLCALSNKIDILTELYNRRTYENEIKQLEGRRSAFLILLDVDYFKIVNDQYGHQFGDTCLRTVAGILSEAFSGLGECYRIGGDEFCVLCTQTDRETVQRRLDRFSRRLTLARQADKRLPTVSYGVSLYKANNRRSFSEVFREADYRMYKHKETLHEETGPIQVVKK